MFQLWFFPNFKTRSVCILSCFSGRNGLKPVYYGSLYPKYDSNSYTLLQNGNLLGHLRRNWSHKARFINRKNSPGNPLAAQWLGLQLLLHGQGTKVLQAAHCGQKKERSKSPEVRRREKHEPVQHDREICEHLVF